MSYLYSWVWSCSTVPGHWELSNIQWHSILPAYNLGCTQSVSQRQRQSCCPYGGHFGAQGLSCTGWRWFVAQLWGKREKEGWLQVTDFKSLSVTFPKRKERTVLLFSERVSLPNTRRRGGISINLTTWSMEWYLRKVIIFINASIVTVCPK